MDKIEELFEITKDYFVESDEFLFTKKFLRKKNKTVSLVLNAYNLEYDLVLKDYKIFFTNKLKTKVVLDTTLSKRIIQKKFRYDKFYLINKQLSRYKFFLNNFSYKDIVMRPNQPLTFKIKRHNLLLKRPRIKIMNRKFFYSKAIEFRFYKNKIKR